MKKYILLLVLLFCSTHTYELTSSIDDKKGTVCWTILICTLDERTEQFNYLHQKLTKQINHADLKNHIEIIYFKDNREFSIGYKRNSPLHAAQGTYINFIDDDDEIHQDYIRMIYEKLKDNPDCVSLCGIITFNGSDPHLFIHSIAFDHYFKKDGVFYRPPNHLNPIKKEIACQFEFPETNWQEDTNWAMQITKSGLLKKEATIEEPYYFYQYITDK